jgi:hypothetical protein
MSPMDNQEATGTSRIPTDADVKSKGEDALDFAPPAERLADKLSEFETPLTFGIYGPWGSGKTTFMNFVKQSLEEGRGGASDVVVWFNPWVYEYAPEGDVLFALLREIETAFPNLKQKEKLNRLKRYALGTGIALADAALRYATGGHLDKGKIDKAIDRISEGASGQYARWVDTTKKFRDDFDAVVEAGLQEDGAHRLVVFVDDMDRCRSANAVKLLEALKNLLWIERAVFIIGVDKEALVDHLETYYPQGSRDYCEEYLDKIIHFWVELPRVPASKLVRAYSRDLLPKELLPLDDDILDTFGTICQGNPRRARRALNRYALLLRLHGSDEVQDTVRVAAGEHIAVAGARTVGEAADKERGALSAKEAHLSAAFLWCAFAESRPRVAATLARGFWNDFAEAVENYPGSDQVGRATRRHELQGHVEDLVRYSDDEPTVALARAWVARHLSFETIAALRRLCSEAGLFSPPDTTEPDEPLTRNT